ncbi:MAG: hypothetical protein JW798_10080 [Prolixibacteraceae bacterium]|nr:hypothetical protein [Prolixibacteraceae bacterium]
MKTQFLKIGKTATIVATLLLVSFTESVNAQHYNRNTTEAKKDRNSQRENFKRPSYNNLKEKKSQNGKSENYKPKAKEFADKSKNYSPENKKQHSHFDPKPHHGKNSSPTLYGNKHGHNPHIYYGNKNYWHKYNKPNIAFRRLPRKAVWVKLDGDSFFFYRNRFYKASPFGYYRVKPPRYIQVLPHGAQLLIVNGLPVYHYFGVHFVKTPFGFEILI